MTQQQILDMLVDHKKLSPALLVLNITRALLVGTAMISFMANEYDNTYLALLGAI